jgi:hypothetical protein
MNAIETGIEIELGVTGGEEDGVDNSDIDNSKLYTQPEDVGQPTLCFCIEHLSRRRWCFRDIVLHVIVESREYDHTQHQRY